MRLRRSPVDSPDPEPANALALFLTAIVFTVSVLSLRCSGTTDSEPETGELQVVTLTSGVAPDPDGYTFQLDGGPAQPIGLNAVATAENLRSGNHAVELALMSSPTSAALTDLWGRSASDVYAVGPTAILHYDGTEWSVVSDAPGRCPARRNCIWGTERAVFILSTGAVLVRDN